MSKRDDVAPAAAWNSNASRPAPRANTGSAFLDRLSDASTLLLQLERRFDPFVRPAFDALFRDPIASLVTALINRRRPNEGLKIAEERAIPDEEAHLESIISSFDTAAERPPGSSATITCSSVGPRPRPSTPMLVETVGVPVISA